MRCSEAHSSTEKCGPRMRLDRATSCALNTFSRYSLVVFPVKCREVLEEPWVQPSAWGGMACADIADIRDAMPLA